MATEAASPAPHRRSAYESTLSLILLGAAIALVALATIQAIRAEHIPPYWDQAWYMSQGLRQLDTLRAGDWSGWFQAWTAIDRARPSLVPLLTMPFYFLFGRAATSALYVNALMISAAMLFVYLLGRRMVRPTVGLAAALLTAAYPLAVGLTRILLVETTLMAMVALTLLALWASEGLSRPAWSIVAGIALGLGLLTKVFFPVFVAAPVTIVVLQAIIALRHGDRLHRRTILRHAFLMVGLMLLIAGPWYALNLGPMVTRSVDTAFGAEARPYGPTNPWQMAQLAAYLRTFSARIVAPAGFALFIVGAASVAFAWRRLARAQRWAAAYLIATIGVTYLVFTSLNNQDPKHISALLPAVAILSAWGLSYLPPTPWLSVLLASLFLGANLSVAAPPPAGDVARARLATVSAWLAPRYDFFDTLRPFATAPASEWPVGAALDYALFVASREPLAPENPLIGIIPNAPAFEEGAFQFEALRRAMRVDIATANLMNLAQFDLLIDKSGDAGLELDFVPYEKVRAQRAAPDSPFVLLPRTYTMPDGSEVHFYSRRPSPLVTSVPPSARSVRAQFGTAAHLLAVDVANPSAAVAPLVEVGTFWETDAPTTEPLRLFFHVLDGPDGAILWQGDHELFAETYPSTIWQEDIVVRDVVQVPHEYVQEGTLHLRIGLYTLAGRLPVTLTGESPGLRATADAITLTWPLD